jgi:trimeric autotransporter adhesin
MIFRCLQTSSTRHDLGETGLSLCLDTATGQATAWNPNPDHGIGALAVSSSTVYAGGGFTSIGGQPCNGIAAVDTDTGAATAWNPNANAPGTSASIQALAIQGPTLYVSGLFDSIGGEPRKKIAAVHTTDATATDWTPNADLSADVRALAASESTVYAGGYFESIGGQRRQNLAALDAATGAATAWNPEPFARLDIPVKALEISGSTLYVGGAFSWVAEQPQRGFAALTGQ